MWARVWTPYVGRATLSPGFTGCHSPACCRERQDYQQKVKLRETTSKMQRVEETKWWFQGNGPPSLALRPLLRFLQLFNAFSLSVQFRECISSHASTSKCRYGLSDGTVGESFGSSLWAKCLTKMSIVLSWCIIIGLRWSPCRPWVKPNNRVDEANCRSKGKIEDVTNVCKCVNALSGWIFARHASRQLSSAAQQRIAATSA